MIQFLSVFVFDIFLLLAAGKRNSRQIRITETYGYINQSLLVICVKGAYAFLQEIICCSGK